MARFFTHMVSEIVQVFWAALQRGEFITDAAAAAGTYRKQGTRWVIANGGVRPRRGRNLTGRYLCFAEREEIALARAAGESMRAIAASAGAEPVDDLPGTGPQRRGDGAVSGDQRARGGLGPRRRPKPAKLATNLALRELVEQYLQAKYSPEQIAGRLRVRVPRRPGDVGVNRDDLPVAVCPVPRCAAAGADQVPAHRAGVAASRPAARAA